MEQQFRYKLYKDPKYPFFPAMGIKHIFQGFDAQEDGYMGTLHLWYTNESGEPSYHTKDKNFISGYWKSEWIDAAVEAVEKAIELEREDGLYSEKLVQVHLKYMEEFSEKIAQELLDKKFKKQMEELEEESKTVLWN
ncbi:uncharacterized protein METZ01_LOCUS263086 [marine metagenome]|uniref:Uncharacterized protein n=1 Tax=marine metagenome TaxID=408172 RepID=A0A382JFU8_9ZZZZ